MCSLKVILFIAALCTVNAAITVNIYDYDGKDVTDVEENLEEVHGCINLVCDELCRLLNFPGGKCVNERCQCNNMKQTDDIEETLLLERRLQEDRTCNSRTCDQLCRRLKFPGGACVNGRCKCDNFKQPELFHENVKDLDSCNWRACDQLCRRLGFPGGVCVGDSCKCDNFRLSNNWLYVNALANEKQIENECNNVECENHCQKLGLVSGYCNQEGCICYKKKRQDEANSLQGCDVVACNEMCHRMNYVGGMCRNGSCYCY